MTPHLPSRLLLRFSLPVLAGAALVAPSVAQKPRPVTSAQDVTVSVKGEPVTFTGGKPLVQDESVLVPFRAVLEKMGATVSYEAASHQINAKQGTHTVQMSPGSKAVKVDGREYNLKTPPKEVAGTVYIPLRFVSESLGAKVGYDKAAHSVTIDPSNTTAPATNAASGSGANEAGNPSANAANPAGNDANNAANDAKNAANAANEAANAANNAANSVNAASANATANAGTNSTNAANTVTNAPTNTPVNAAANAGTNAGSAAATNGATNAPPRVRRAPTTAANTAETSEPADLSWVKYLLGLLGLGGLAGAVYVFLKNRRAGQVIASSDDTKKR